MRKLFPLIAALVVLLSFTSTASAAWTHLGGDPLVQGGVHTRADYVRIVTSGKGATAMTYAGLNKTERKAVVKGARTGKFKSCVMRFGQHFVAMSFGINGTSVDRNVTFADPRYRNGAPAFCQDAVVTSTTQVVRGKEKIVKTVSNKDGSKDVFYDRIDVVKTRVCVVHTLMPKKCANFAVSSRGCKTKTKLVHHKRKVHIPPPAQPAPPAPTISCPGGTEPHYTNAGVIDQCIVQSNTTTVDQACRNAGGHLVSSPSTQTVQCVVQVIEVNANCSNVTILLGDGSHQTVQQGDNCNVVVVDFCTNISGNQSEVPSGMILVGDICTSPTPPPANCHDTGTCPLPPAPPKLTNPTNPEEIDASGEGYPNVCVTVTGKNGNSLTISFGATYGSFVPTLVTITSKGTDRVCSVYYAPLDAGAVGKNDVIVYDAHDNNTGLDAATVSSLPIPIHAMPPAPPA